MKLAASLAICFAVSAAPVLACDFQVSSPANGATVINPVTMTIKATGTTPSGPWMNYYLDGAYNQSGSIPTSTSAPPQTVSFGSLSTTTHTLVASEYKASGASGLVCSTTVNVTVADSDYRIISPVNGATVSGQIGVQVNQPSGFGGWVNLHVDGKYIASTPPWTIPWDTTTALNGATHTLDAQYLQPGGTQVADPTVAVKVQQGTAAPPPSPTPAPGATPTPSGSLPPNWISSMTGAAANMAITVDTNINDFGNYNAPGTNSINGQGMIGGPLITDVQAASKVLPTNPSSRDGTANLAIDDYFQTIAKNNPSDYSNQVGSFESEAGSSHYGGAIGRMDGACPLKNPTTGEVLQWAANKWGLNPVLAYAAAANESGWDPGHVGDCDSGGVNCASHGILQVADTNTASRPNHAFPGFTGASANLAKEGTCFNADYWAGHTWAAYYGLTGETAQNNDNIDTALQSWFQGNTSGPGSYSQQIDDIIAQGWQAALSQHFGVTFPNGQYLTGAPAQPVSSTP